MCRTGSRYLCLFSFPSWIGCRAKEVKVQIWAVKVSVPEWKQSKCFSFYQRGGMLSWIEPVQSARNVSWKMSNTVLNWVLLEGGNFLSGDKKTLFHWALGCIRSNNMLYLVVHLPWCKYDVCNLYMINPVLVHLSEHEAKVVCLPPRPWHAREV